MTDKLRKMNLYPNQRYQEKIAIDTNSVRKPPSTTIGGSKMNASISCNSIMSSVFRGHRGEKGGCGCGK